MHGVALFPSRVEAQYAALYLLEHGVMARVHEAPGDAWVFRRKPGEFGGVEVRIADASERELAEALLDEWRALPAPDPAWELAIPEPDLSRLDPALDIPCSGCGHDLRGTPTTNGDGRCPGCERRFDVAERIVSRHGPEALERCYPPPAPIVDDAVAEAAPVPCPRCAYPLGGLPPTGVCPECAAEYDKRAIIRAYVLGVHTR